MLWVLGCISKCGCLSSTIVEALSEYLVIRHENLRKDAPGRWDSTEPQVGRSREIQREFGQSDGWAKGKGQMAELEEVRKSRMLASPQAIFV